MITIKKTETRTTLLTIEFSPKEYEQLKRISGAKNIDIETLILNDIRGLIGFYEEQYKSIGLVL